MAKSIWDIDLDGKKHTVGLTHGNVTGKIDISVDGKNIDIPKSEQPKFMESSHKYEFLIAGHPSQIAVNLDGSRYVYLLMVDGQLITKTTAQNQKEQEESNTLRSMTAAPLLVLLGAFAFWFNWNAAHTREMVSRSIALISPLPILFAFYLLLFPNDVAKFSTNAVIRLVIVIVLAIILGWVNFYALSTGMY